MKRKVIISGVGYSVLGLIFLLIAVFTEYKLEGLLWGFGGAGLGSGLVLIYKFIHWSKPEKEAEYKERLKFEHIEMTDERKVMLRDKSGCITYHAMVWIYCALILVFSAMSTMKYFMPVSKYLVIVLVILLVFQYTFGIVVFNILNKRF